MYCNVDCRLIFILHSCIRWNFSNEKFRLKNSLSKHQTVVRDRPHGDLQVSGYGK